MKNHILALLAVVMLFATTTKAKAQVNIQDSLALVDLYDSTGGPNWTNHTNWLTNAPVSTWYGVTVSGGRVIKIIFVEIMYLGNNLIGRIPVSIGNLGALQVLELDNNKLTGSIPSSLGNLTSLTQIDFTTNKLTGNIPSSLGKLTNLTSLSLGANALNDTIPPSLANLVNLTTLDLGYNKLSGSIPVWLDRLVNLSYLNLGYNQFTDTIPVSLSKLVNLQGIDLSDNKITGSIPSSFGNLTKLIQLNFSNNQLSGSIPASFVNLTKLTSLYLAGNQLNGFIPAFIGSFTNLTILYLAGNELNGSIPTSFGNLKKLQWLGLSYNQLSGPIPDTLGSLTNLTNIYLSNNQLSGAIPSRLSNLASLKALYISNNKFTFDGLETLVKKDTFAFYAPQANIPINQNGSILFVAVGGTPANNNFKWYRNSVLVQSQNGDSTYTPTSNGNYWVVATNAVATKLSLHSDTITITNLPIKAINLQANSANGQVLLQWQTIDELNTALFTIQQSIDGKTFTDISTTTAVGKGNNAYSFMDNLPAERLNYYRIKAIDKDGSVSYSKVVSCQLSTINYQLSINPNPAKDFANIHFSTAVDKATITVYDLTGKAVIAQSLNGSTNTYKLNTQALANGVYTIKVNTPTGSYNEKLLINR
ncbi:leucine-rich repeat domain-containing protein [Parasediminibacterium sp. JCM 36343]|uniref:leucine-rich repeat domain-containing protein n=1 Tax=Parasediminibacterium sp. JCM 36343 TaxID=3374279 RepID=UPI00397B766B